MVKENKGNQETKKVGITPYVIIAVIFAATVAGIWMIASSGGQDADAGTNTTPTGNSGGVTGNEIAQVPNYTTAPPGASPAHFKGSEAAAVIVEEFADFQCPTCATVHPRMNEITSKYGSRIKFVFRNYPLTNMHPNAYDAAVASEAAGLQGKFWDMQNILFANQAQWSASTEARRIFSEYAQRIGLDVEKFNNDILAFGTKSRVDLDMNRGRALNITGTPSILVNGRPVPSFEVSEINKLIDAELAKLAPQEEPNSATEGNTETQDK